MPDHKGTVKLCTPRLILRRLIAEDAQQMFENWASDKEVTKFMRWEPHKDLGQTRALLETWQQDYESEKVYLWGIENRQTGALMGSIGAIIHEQDWCAEVGYCLGRAFWSNGYMTEALREVIRFLLTDVGLNRVEAFHSVYNPASGRVMQKAGMLYEGRARGKYLCSMGFQDSDMYGVLKSDLVGEK